MPHHCWYNRTKGSDLWILFIVDKHYKLAERIKNRREDISPNGTEFAYLEVDEAVNAPERTRELPGQKVKAVTGVYHFIRNGDRSPSWGIVTPTLNVTGWHETYREAKEAIDAPSGTGGIHPEYEGRLEEVQDFDPNGSVYHYIFK